jgi:glucose-6-phosphate 1-dehydrogenase
LGKHDQLIEAQSAQQDERAPAGPPCVMVIFGAAGDLTKRLVVPALYNLAHAEQLSGGFQLVGVDLAPDQHRSMANRAHRLDEKLRRP